MCKKPKLEYEPLYLYLCVTFPPPWFTYHKIGRMLLLRERKLGEGFEGICCIFLSGKGVIVLVCVLLMLCKKGV